MSLLPQLSKLQAELREALADDNTAATKKALRQLTKRYAANAGGQEGLPTVVERLEHAKEWIGCRMMEPKQAETMATLLDALASWATLDGVRMGIESAQRGGRQPSYDSDAIVKAFRNGDTVDQVISRFGVGRTTAYDLQRKAFADESGN